MAIHARTPDGEEPRAIFSNNTIRAELDDGTIEGMVLNCGGYVDHDASPEDMFFDAGLEESLVWAALGRDCSKAHDWVLVVTSTAPQAHWLGEEAQVSCVYEHQVRPFAPLTVAGWLSRLGADGKPEFLVVLTRRDL